MPRFIQNPKTQQELEQCGKALIDAMMRTLPRGTSRAVFLAALGGAVNELLILARDDGYGALADDWIRALVELDTENQDGGTA